MISTQKGFMERFAPNISISDYYQDTIYCHLSVNVFEKWAFWVVTK
jgi:hypothetical protein